MTVGIASATFLPPGGVARGIVAKMMEAVSIRDFNATGDGSTDDTAAIQAAVDWALANNASVVYAPPGNYKITNTIYLDPPGNLRVSLSAPTIFNFTLAFVGPEAYGSGDDGASFQFNQTDRAAFYVGTGQGMRIAGIYINNSSYATHAKIQNSACAAIAISGGNGGTHTTLIERVRINGFYNGVLVSNNHDSLGDDTTIRSCEIQRCYRCVAFIGSQAYINTIDNCQLQYSNIAVYSARSTPVYINGGHYNGPYDFEKFTITASSATLVDFTDSTTATTVTNQRFTVTLSSPDAKMTAGVYDQAALKTTNFGYVPVVIESYVGTTLTCTLSPSWVASTIGFLWNYRADTDLQADIRACTSIFVAVRSIVFWGTAIHAMGMHIESPNAAITLHKSRAIGGSAPQSTIQNLLFNYPMGHDNSANTGGASEALFVLQQSWAFIELQQGSLEISGCHAYGSDRSSDPIIIEIFQTAKDADLVVRNMTWQAPAVRICVQYPEGSGYARGSYWTRQTSAGQFAPGTLLSAVDSAASGYETDSVYREKGRGLSPSEGHRPARYVLPYLSKADVALINTTSPAIGTVPLVYGETIYQTGGNGVDDDYLFVKSSHSGWSFGTALDVDWTKRGFSPVMRVTTGDDVAQLFPGLRFSITEDSPHNFIITGVHRTAGYVTVMQDVGSNQDYISTGVKTTTYNGTSLGQQAVWLRTFGSRAASVAAALTGGSVTPDFSKGTVIPITATSAVTVNAPTNPIVGQEYTVIVTQSGAGAFAVTWNAVFKMSTWSNTGNTTGTSSVIKFTCTSSTVFRQSATQTPYVA